MDNSVVASLIVAGVAGAWKVYSTFAERHRFLNEKKAEYYQRVIASEEELHEAYFDGVPDSDSDRKVKGWYKSDIGWLHEADWIRSPRYLSGATDMNWCLAGIVLFASDEIASECNDLENIAQLPFSNPDRPKKMNKLVDLMRADLKTQKHGDLSQGTWA